MQEQVGEMKTAATQTERAIAASNRLGEEAAKTADESRRLAEAAITSNTMTKQLAAAAVQANQINRESLTSVQRPFIEVKGIEFETLDFKNQGSSLWFGYVSIENTGNTPPVDLFVHVGCYTANTGIADVFSTQDEFNPHNISGVGRSIRLVIGPKQIKRAGYCIVNPPYVERQNESSSYFRYIYGRAEYRDAFTPKTVHLTEFCFMVYVMDLSSIFEVNSKYWQGNTVACPNHNCADNECEKYDLDRAANDLPATPAPVRRR
jgi:hypothetical protein